MARITRIFDTPELLSPHLCRTDSDPRPVVLMTCGMAGSGKSSLSKWILSNHPSFKRLSIDSYIYTKYGLYGVDYPENMYHNYQDEAQSALQTELPQLLQQGFQDAILDLSCAFQKTRNEWKQLIEESGGRWVLAYLDVDDDELRRRVWARNQLAVKDGDSAFFMTNEILESFLAGFERPIGEGEIILRFNTKLNEGINE